MSFRLTKLDYYLTQALVTTVLFAVVLFSIIWLAPETLFKLVQYTFGGNINITQALTLFSYHIPGVLQQSIPIAVLLGCLFVMQRFSQQFELIAMFAAGISPLRILQPVIITGLVFAGLHWVSQEYITPITGPLLEKTYAQWDLKDAKDRNFVFVEKNDQNQLEKFLLIGQINPQIKTSDDTLPASQFPLREFIVLYYHPIANQMDRAELGGAMISRILKAKAGQWDSQTKQWELLDGIEYDINEEGVFNGIRRFDIQQVKMSRYAHKLLEFSKSNPLDFSWDKLRRYIDTLQEGGQLQDVSTFEVRLHQKLAAPFASIFFAIAGALLGIERVRASRSFSLIFGAALVFIYSVLTPFVGNVVSFTAIPAMIAAWLPLLVSIGVFTLLLKSKDLLGSNN